MSLATVSPTDPKFRTAISNCVAALRRMARNELDSSLQRRMQELGERKEFLDKSEHDELTALVEFTQQRTIEKLDAELALKHLQEVCPELVDST